MNQPLDPIQLGRAGRWLELAQQGKDAWNSWAEEERQKAESDRVTIQLAGNLGHGDWEGFVFPGPVEFVDVVFSQRTSFGNARFDATANFARARFEDDAHFEGMMFSSRACFTQARFRKQAAFLSGDKDPLLFGSDADFRGAEFQGRAAFLAEFNRNADFEGAVFHDSANFFSAVFRGNVIFRRAVIQDRLTLPSAESWQGLVRYDGMAFRDAATEWGFVQRLKELAELRRDHRMELDAFAREMRIRRRSYLKWRYLKDWPELILNTVYWLVADYGRSVVRPLIGLLTTYLAFVAVFTGAIGESCRNEASGWPWKLAAINLLPLSGQTGSGWRIIETEPALQGRLGQVYGIGVVENLVAIIALFLMVLGLRNLFRIKL